MCSRAAPATCPSSASFHHPACIRWRLDGRKLRRQHSVGNYILDFYRPEEQLAIELDGAAHNHETAVERDAARTHYLESLGITVARFENREIFENLDGALAAIRAYFKTTA